MTTFPMDGHEFALCLTHDVDRPYKTNQALYYAIADRQLHHLKALLPGERPWWQFDRIVELEAELGVRSAFYFLREPHLLRERSPSKWRQPFYWIEHLGRYDPSSPELATVIRELDESGWEVGIHGSYGTHDDVERLRYEKDALESTLGHEILGGRQHHLRFDRPETWRHYRDIGLQYDASPGSSTDLGFEHGYDVLRPFDDEFVVFPMTIMEKALENRTESQAEAWEVCRDLLDEARENNAVMTVLWHPRNFNERDYPGHCELYRRLIERALEMGAWVGAPGELYRKMDRREIRDGGDPGSPSADDTRTANPAED